MPYEFVPLPKPPRLKERKRGCMENKIEFKELKIEVDRTDSVFFDWDVVEIQADEILKHDCRIIPEKLECTEYRPGSV